MPREEQTVWNRFAFIYDRIVQKDDAIYQEMIGRIACLAAPEDRVLEIATGTGIIALKLAGQIDRIDAIDFSPDMIREAEKKALGLGIGNVDFSVQDATCLSYDSSAFDLVIISNALHIMPQPERVLAEIGRVLKRGGRLVAPTYLHRQSKKAAILSRLMGLTGFRAYHRWTEQGYRAFLAENGFNVVELSLYPGLFPLAYTVAEKKGE